MVRKIHFSSVPLILTWTIKSFLKSWNCCDSLVLRSTCQALSQSVISNKSVVEPPKSAKEVNYHSIDTTMVMKHPAKTNARIIGHDVTMWETGCNERSKKLLGIVWRDRIKVNVHGALQLLAVSQWNKSSEMQLIFTITEFQRTLMQQVCLLQSRKLLACLWLVACCCPQNDGYLLLTQTIPRAFAVISRTSSVLVQSMANERTGVYLQEDSALISDTI